MIGSLPAAEANGKGTALRRGLPCRFLLAGMVATLLGACGAGTPETRLPAQSATARAAETPTLAGLSDKEVVALFGEPDFRRVEPPAELWQYRSAGCVLDLFLYSDAAGVHVVRSETHDRGPIQPAADHCSAVGDPLVLRIRQSRL
jgi:hypothetical protein